MSHCIKQFHNFSKNKCAYFPFVQVIYMHIHTEMLAGTTCLNNEHLGVRFGLVCVTLDRIQQKPFEKLLW